MFSGSKFAQIELLVYGQPIPRNCKFEADKGMLDRISDLQDLTKNLGKLETTVNGYTYTGLNMCKQNVVGLVQKLKTAEDELAKLKAIVNELVDYVYSQKESK